MLGRHNIQSTPQRKSNLLAFQSTPSPSFNNNTSSDHIPSSILSSTPLPKRNKGLRFSTPRRSSRKQASTKKEGRASIERLMRFEKDVAIMSPINNITPNKTSLASLTLTPSGITFGFEATPSKTTSSTSSATKNQTIIMLNNPIGTGINTSPFFDDIARIEKSASPSSPSTSTSFSSSSEPETSPSISNNTSIASSRSSTSSKTYLTTNIPSPLVQDLWIATNTTITATTATTTNNTTNNNNENETTAKGITKRRRSMFGKILSTLFPSKKLYNKKNQNKNVDDVQKQKINNSINKENQHQNINSAAKTNAIRKKKKRPRGKSRRNKHARNKQRNTPRPPLNPPSPPHEQPPTTTSSILERAARTTTATTATKTATATSNTPILNKRTNLLRHRDQPQSHSTPIQLSKNSNDTTLLAQNTSQKNSNNNLSTSDDTALQMIIRRPLHELHTLHLRSEVMEHNITLGLNVLSYLQDTCGLSPKRASEFVRPILTNETQMIETKGIRTFTPIKHYALKQYGQIAFSKKVTPFVRKKKREVV